jgi:hypothetical protein
MMAAPVQAVNEPEYGAKVEQERSAEALAAAQPAPMPEIVDSGIEPVPFDQPQIAEDTEYMTFKNPYMLLPPGINFPEQAAKTQVERDYDMGLFWQILAEDAQNDPRIQEVARTLMRER